MQKKSAVERGSPGQYCVERKETSLLLCTDSELDLAHYGYAQIGFSPCFDAFSACFEHHSFVLLS